MYIKNRKSSLAQPHRKPLVSTSYIVNIFLSSGVYVAAHDLKMEWVVVKGISGYADGTGGVSDEWKTFASVMAASVVENMLSDSAVFQSWPHFEGDVTLFFLKPKNWFLYPRRFINCVTIINLIYDYDHLTRYFGSSTELIL